MTKFKQGQYLKMIDWACENESSEDSEAAQRMIEIIHTFVSIADSKQVECILEVVVNQKA